MKKPISILSFLVLLISSSFAQDYSAKSLPAAIYSGPQEKMHVQGAVVDQQKGFVYMSFTNKLLKYDTQGKLLGSLTGFIGHLGDLDFDPNTGLVYGSLEYKNDAIGKGIAQKLGVKTLDENGFYVAIIDVNKITKTDMNAETEKDILKTVYIKEAVDDFNASVKIGDKSFSHRFACSGIDGLALAPSITKPNDGKKYLYVAYGVYGDTTRTDNDYQVILQYDISEWSALAKPLSQESLHHSGPQKPNEKYFVFTGNTNWGIQNLAYDDFSGNFYAAVYKGKKSIYPNYDLFVISSKQSPGKTTVTVDNKKQKVKTLALLNAGQQDEKSQIRGWRFKWGSTGIVPLGDGYFYISHNKKDKEKREESTLYKYRWVGSETTAFERVK